MPIVTSWCPSRRTALCGLAALPSGLVAARPALGQTVRKAGGSPAPGCAPMPQSVEGPFYFDPGLRRSDITEGRPGVPLVLRFVVLDAARCTPLAEARIDAWHANAEGFYSGYPGQGESRSVDTRGETFLRGTQMTDETGAAMFRTIYPGWYPGRTTHIHFKVFVEQRNVSTGQLYFPDALSEYIYANVVPYRTRRDRRDSFNTTDAIVRMDEARAGFCDIKEERDHYLARLTIAVDLAAAAVSEGEADRPPLPMPREGRPPLPPGGPPPMSPRETRPAVVVPGVAPADQQGG